MPSYMFELEQEFKKSIRPSNLTLNKKEFVKEWVTKFDETLYSSNNMREEFFEYNVLQLEEAFEFTIKHFAELDLGGNMKWCSFTKTSLSLIDSGDWNEESKSELIFFYLKDTRWFDF